MKKNWKDIALIVIISLNVFQFISDEAKDWYALTRQAEPNVSEQKSINMGMAGRIDRDEVKQLARGVE